MTAREAALEAACGRMRAHADNLVAAVRARDRTAVEIVLAAARTLDTPGADPADVLAVVLADRCAQLAAAAGVAV